MLCPQIVHLIICIWKSVKWKLRMSHLSLYTGIIIHINAINPWILFIQIEGGHPVTKPAEIKDLLENEPRAMSFTHVLYLH